MARVCLLLMISCFASQAVADAGQVGQRAELQVGVLLRIIKREADSAATAPEEPVEEGEASAPATSVPSATTPSATAASTATSSAAVPSTIVPSTIGPSAVGPFDGGSPSLTGVFDVVDPLRGDAALDQTQVPGLAYPLTGSVSVGVGYSFIEAEDLVVDRAVDGMLDVDHQVIISFFGHFGISDDFFELKSCSNLKRCFT